ncbi:glutathione S-transferase Mu 1 isoform X4 [Hyalella azteca]|uniref:glutathione transferase n=2 Tax=Hyalella azteca TaxID=294128 RepID=A0A8B7P6A2_HYAAZ|nr:glutathione S-transferase Mu 1 isoform X1 [Hyalella azteca]XP_018021577.1 glutathione S-transferase Mu 1 isoform X4 [Hyalella azteca]
MPVLGYWSVRGLAEPIRTLLAHTGTEYENKTYDMGPAPTYDRSQWLNVKPTIDLDLPNLPYYMDGDVKLTESSAIIRHLGRKTGLAGATEQEKMRIDVAESLYADQTGSFVRLIISPNYESDKIPFEADIKDKLQKFATLLGSSKYIAGEEISYADFLILELLDRYESFSPSALAAFPTLKALQTRLLDLPGVKARRDSPEFKKISTRLFGRMHKFGHGEESY